MPTIRTLVKCLQNMRVENTKLFLAIHTYLKYILQIRRAGKISTCISAQFVAFAG